MTRIKNMPFREFRCELCSCLLGFLQKGYYTKNTYLCIDCYTRRIKEEKIKEIRDVIR